MTVGQYDYYAMKWIKLCCGFFVFYQDFQIYSINVNKNTPKYIGHAISKCVRVKGNIAAWFKLAMLFTVVLERGFQLYFTTDSIHGDHYND